MNSWVPKKLLRESETLVAPSNEQIGSTSPLSERAANSCIVAIKASGVAGTVNATLQSAIDSNDAGAWLSTKSVALANGWNYIKLSINIAADQTYLPLLTTIRVIADGAGTVTIDRCEFIGDQ